MKPLPGGTAEGCRIPLDYSRLRLAEIGQENFKPEGGDGSSEIGDQPPGLMRDMALDQAFRQLLHQISYAQAEYRHQAEEIDGDDVVELAIKPDSTIAEDIASLGDGAQAVEKTFQDLGARLDRETSPGSHCADQLRRQARDVEAHTRLARNELRQSTIRQNRLERITSVLLRMPQIIENTGKAIAIGTDVLEPFANQWFQFWADVQNLSLKNLRRFGENLQKVGQRLKENATPSKTGTNLPREALAVFRDVDESWCPEMVVIPSARFLMGSPDSEGGREKWESPQHRVRFDQRFAICRFPITFEQYDQFCRETGRKKPADNGWGRRDRPIVNVSFADATAFCHWLSERTKAPYSLPSEAAWEYACRAGSRTRYAFGDLITHDQANFGNPTAGTTKPVGTYQPNPWGIHDMHGNTWEWCLDVWHLTYQGAPDDGSPWVDDGDGGTIREGTNMSQGLFRVIRGGSRSDSPEKLRSASRNGHHMEKSHLGLGFRCLRALD